MNFNEYQSKAHETADYPEIFVFDNEADDGSGEAIPANYIYAAMGIASESGELLEKIKKIVRNNNGKFDEDELDAIKKEIGDVEWYLAELCTIFEISLNDIVIDNIKKLQDRKKRGVIKSSGDNR